MTEYYVDDLKIMAYDVICKLKEKGYEAKLLYNNDCNRYGFVFSFKNGKTYTTGLDSKVICAEKLKKLATNIDMLVVNYCETDNI